MDFSRNKHFKYGAPFLLAVVGGSFMLKYYSELRYDIQRERHIISKTKALSTGKVTDIEDEYQEYKKVNIDDWQNIRGPRPWEEKNEDYKKLIEKRAEESKNRWVFKS